MYTGQNWLAMHVMQLNTNMWNILKLFITLFGITTLKGAMIKILKTKSVKEDNTSLHEAISQWRLNKYSYVSS